MPATTKPLQTEEARQLRLFLKRNEPLGPIAAEIMINHELAARKLFERQSDVHSQLFANSGIVIGRRGSGKTAFLDSLRASRPAGEVVYLSAPDVFPSILKSIRGVFGVNSPSAEVVAHLWDMLIWAAVFGTLLQNDEDARIVGIRRFAIEFGFGETDSPAEVIRCVVAHLTATAKSRDVSIDSRLDLIDLADGPANLFTNAVAAAKTIITARRGGSQRNILVLMDTMEDYRLEQGEANDALGGLVRYLGVQSYDEEFVDIRFCLPAELYETFRRASSNSAKDFGAQAVLHWSAGELWRIAAHRLALFLELHDPDSYDRLDAAAGLTDRAGAIAFFRRLLPAEIACEDHVEQSLTHIARHTQLLPRDLIHVLNRVLLRAVEPETLKLGTVTETMVRDGVAEAEFIIADGIRSAFKHRYPHFRDLCAAAIPELKRRFTEGELRTVFNRKVKGVFKRLAAAGVDAECSFYDFTRMLAETGALGKQINETEMFWECQFEYSLPGEMVVSSQDMLCVHPLFNDTFPSRINGQSPKLVYPYGTDPDQE